jgi:hypothetical protein
MKKSTIQTILIVIACIAFCFASCTTAKKSGYGCPILNHGTAKGTIIGGRVK